jgi:hypothetical protein
MANGKDEIAAEHDILLCSYSTYHGENYLGPLRQRGFQVTLTASITEVPTLITRLKLPILVVDCGPKQEGTVELLRVLVNSPDLFRYPLILIGPDVDVSERMLNERYLLAATICNPVTAVDLIEGILYVARSTKAARRRVDPPTRPEAPAPPPSTTQTVFAGNRSIPEILIRTLEDNNLLGRSLGGREYPKYHHGKLVNLPRLGRLEPHFQARSELLGPWTISHLARTAYVVEQLAIALHFPSQDSTLAWQAAYLLGIGLQPGQREILRIDYSRTKGDSTRKDLCSRLKDSAMQVGVEIQQPELSGFIALIARQVGHEEIANEEPRSKLASLLVACELADRVIFQSGFWSPRAAYYLMRKFKSGSCNDIHPLMLAVVMKYVSEALAASPPSFLLTKSVRENPALQAEAGEPIREGETKVPLDSLAPGMRLSRPLKAFDGRQILSEDLVLDEDLIFRIWQLAAVRPLNSAIVVSPVAERPSPEDSPT